MRIISKFHDFYDIGLKFGIDPSCLYKREMIEFHCDQPECHEIANIIMSAWNNNNNKVENIHLDGIRNIDYCFIVFCGKIYRQIRIRVGYGWYDSYDSKEFIIYNMDSYNKFVNKMVKDGKHSDLVKRLKKINNMYRADEVKRFFDCSQLDGGKKIYDLLVKYGVPIIQLDLTEGYSLSYPKVTLNPFLSKIEFFRQIDPYTAFQEISMFISGVLGGESPPMIKVSDKVRLEKHGFSSVTSFRKMHRN